MSKPPLSLDDIKRKISLRKDGRTKNALVKLLEVAGIGEMTYSEQDAIFKRLWNEDGCTHSFTINKGGSWYCEYCEMIVSG